MITLASLAAAGYEPTGAALVLWIAGAIIAFIVLAIVGIRAMK